MRVIEAGRLTCERSYPLPPLLEDVEFRRCTVERCQHPAQQSGPADRPVIRNVRITRCHIEASDLPPVVVEDSEVDTIWFRRGIWGPQRLPGCAFRHVVIRGRITGSVAFTPSPAVHLRATTDITADPYVLANARFYETVDWALDISEAEFTSVELGSGIPAALVRRDPSTQAVLHRSTLVDGRWRELAGETLARIWIEDLLASGFDDRILVAPKRSTRFAAELDLIRKLVDLGYAEF